MLLPLYYSSIFLEDFFLEYYYSCPTFYFVEENYCSIISFHIKYIPAMDYLHYYIIIIIIIISAHESDLSNPWSQTQASLSIPSLDQKNTNKRREREEKNNRRENLPRSDRRGREKIKQEQKKQKQRPATHIRETNR